MQAVILAAGLGTRLRPLTYKVAKCMIGINEKNLIEYNIEQLSDEINELIIVIGHLGEQIKDYFGDKYKGKKITYIKQDKLLGTGHALHLCKDILKGRFLVLMGDNIYCRQDVEKCLKHEQCILTQEINGEFTGGRITINGQGELEKIVEGTHKEDRSLINAALYVMNKNFFDYDLVPIRQGKEFGLPQTLVKVAKDYPINIEKATFWLQINNLEELEKAKEVLTKRETYVKVKT